jgi:membrane protein
LLGAQLSFYVQNPDYLRFGQRPERLANALRERLALSAMLLVGRDFIMPGHGWRIESLSAQMRVPRHMLAPVIECLMDAGLLARTNENRLIPARDPRNIELTGVLDAMRGGEIERHDGGDDWNPTVSALVDGIDAAIRAAVTPRSLADLVEADVQREAAEQATASANAPEQTGPRT